MPREVKHDRRAFVEEAAPRSSAALASADGTSQPPRSAPAFDGPRSSPPTSHRSLASRWFAALDPHSEHAADAPLPSPLAALPLTIGAVAAAALVNGIAFRGAVAGVFLLAAAGVVLRWYLAQRVASGPSSYAARASDERGRGIALDGERLAFLPGRRHSRPSLPMNTDAPRGLPGAPRSSAGPRSSGGLGSLEVCALSAPFGVTLLASPRRDRLIALLSSASGTFYLGASFDAAARRAFAPLLDRCHTVVGDDAGMEAIGPDGEPLVLAPEELASLLDALVERSPSCLDRFVLTDARGASITLDGRQLCVGDRAVDLSAPLEWKPIVFQEAFGQAIAVYQGTWIRQSSTELTLVSLLPALGPAPAQELEGGALDRGVLRDLRLMQASPEAPPPNEQRVAIDRLFMLPVRSALDRAPRASQEAHPQALR
jgi:hypothetical protein